MGLIPASGSSYLVFDGPNRMGSYNSHNSRFEQPRSVVVLAGTAYLPISVEVTMSAHGTLGTASVTLPISSNPDFSTILKAQQNDGSVVAQIYIGFPATPSADLSDFTELQRVFWGVVDTLEPRFGESNEVTITMRSLGALLELTKHTNLSLNETTTAFVIAAANAVGLKYQIVLKKNQVPGTLGEVYGRDLMQGFHNERISQTLVECAEYDDVDCWVSDDTLHYCDPGSIQRTVVPLRWGYDFIAFSGKHSPQFNKNIKVEVRTSNPKIRFSHTVRHSYNADGDETVSESTRETISTQDFGSNATTRSSSSQNLTTGSSSTSTTTSAANPQGGIFNTGKTTIPSDSSAEVFIVRIGNLNREKANSLARKIALQISRNEFSATMTLTPSAQQLKDITITSWLTVTDLPYARFNTSSLYRYYWPRRITLKFDQAGSGLSMDIEAINHRLPQGQV
jgi:hypothetical protein